MLVQARVVAVIDENLRDARAGSRHGERDGAAQVADAHRVVRQRLVRPGRFDRRVPARAELRHETRDHAKEPRAVVEAAAHEVVEAERAQRCPCPDHLERDRPLAGLERHPERVGRRLAQGGRLRCEQHRVGCGERCRPAGAAGSARAAGEQERSGAAQAEHAGWRLHATNVSPRRHAVTGHEVHRRACAVGDR